MNNRPINSQWKVKKEESSKKPKGKSEAVNWRRIDNEIVKRPKRHTKKDQQNTQNIDNVKF